MEQSRTQVEEAALRGGEFLTSSQLATGALTDQLRDPARFLMARRPSRASVFKAMGGADVWHTVSALSALNRIFTRTRTKHDGARKKGEDFVRRHVHQEGGLSYWSTTRGLCCETTSFAAATIPQLSRSLRAVLRRVALPHGRWPQLLLERDNGYSDYSVGPSVTAWVLSAIGSSDPRFKRGLNYLTEALHGREIWDGHAGYYLTPLYPAHVASISLRRKSVLKWVLSNQKRDGGWGYERHERSRSSVLPTAYALLTLDCFDSDAAIRRAVQRGHFWLLARQRHDGRFPLNPRPNGLWYSGDVYASSMAILALLGRKDDGVLSGS